MSRSISGRSCVSSCKDIEGMMQYVKCAHKRRNAPSSCVDLVVYVCFFFQNCWVNVERVSSGFARDSVSSQVWHERLFPLLVCIYPKQWMPVAWASTEAIFAMGFIQSQPLCTLHTYFQFLPHGQILFCTSSDATRLVYVVRSASCVLAPQEKGEPSSAHTDNSQEAPAAQIYMAFEHV